jgi:hypothetical protein
MPLRSGAKESISEHTANLPGARDANNAACAESKRAAVSGPPAGTGVNGSEQESRIRKNPESSACQTGNQKKSVSTEASAVIQNKAEGSASHIGNRENPGSSASAAVTSNKPEGRHVLTGIERLSQASHGKKGGSRITGISRASGLGPRGAFVHESTPAASLKGLITAPEKSVHQTEYVPDITEGMQGEVNSETKTIPLDKNELFKAVIPVGRGADSYSKLYADKEWNNVDTEQEPQKQHHHHHSSSSGHRHHRKHRKRITALKVVKGILITTGASLVCAGLLGFGALKVMDKIGRESLYKAVRSQYPDLSQIQDVYDDADTRVALAAGADDATWKPGWVRYNGQIYEYNSQLLTFLVMGIDNMEPVSVAEDFQSGGQADDMFLLVLDPEKSEISMIAVNRNTMSDIDVYAPEGRFLGT